MRHPRIPALETLERRCAEWNAHCPEGTPVIYYPVIGLSRGWETVTRSGAFVLSGHTACVFVERVAACVALDALEVLPQGGQAA